MRKAELASLHKIHLLLSEDMAVHSLRVLKFYLTSKAGCLRPIYKLNTAKKVYYNLCLQQQYKIHVLHIHVKRLTSAKSKKHYSLETQHFTQFTFWACLQQVITFCKQSLLLFPFVCVYIFPKPSLAAKQMCYL